MSFTFETQLEIKNIVDLLVRAGRETFCRDDAKRLRELVFVEAGLKP